MARPTVLVVEDDPAIRRGVTDALTFKGYDVLSEADGDAGLERALRARYDLLVLDLILPGRGGLELLAELREARPTMPVIVLTAMGGEDERVRGLELGADDYVVKPFSIRELLARVEAVLRRSAERPLDVAEVTLGDVVVDLAREEVRHADGGRDELSTREVELLRYLAAHAGRTIAREELLERVWRLNPRSVETRTIDVHVARLRQKLRDDPASPRHLFTVRGKGYRFEVDVGQP